MRSYAAWILVALAATVVTLLSLQAPEWFRYDRDAILEGEWWRLLSAHLSHLSWAHFGLNIAALGLTGYVAATRHSLVYHLAVWLGLFLFTGIGLLLFAPDLLYYVGLSGALHGALIIYIWDSPFYSRLVRRVVIAVVCAKVLWEQSPWFDDMANAGLIGGRTESRSHLLGTIAGLIWITGVWIRRRYDPQKRSMDC